MKRLLPCTALFLATAAAAHPGHLEGGFLAGLAHPFGGWDHLLAMLAVGLWAQQSRGSARWAMPAAFVAATVAGGLLAAGGLLLPLLESGIALSVLVLGAILALALRLPLAAALPLLAVFALFHGYAHVAEMPGQSLLTYLLGFVAGTALLHGLGWLLGMAGQRLPRLAGGAIAATGLVMLLG